MFTGIVQGTGLVVAIEEKSNFRTHVVELPIDMLPELALGGVSCSQWMLPHRDTY